MQGIGGKPTGVQEEHSARMFSLWSEVGVRLLYWTCSLGWTCLGVSRRRRGVPCPVFAPVVPRWSTSGHLSSGQALHLPGHNIFVLFISILIHQLGIEPGLLLKSLLIIDLVA